MTDDRSPLSHHLIFALMGLALLALVGRLWFFQVTRHDDMDRRADGQQRMSMKIPARRGNIYASSYSRSELMASSHQVFGCFADPKIIPADRFDEVCWKIAELLDVDPDELLAKLTARRQRRFVWIKRDLDADAVKAVRERRLPGIGLCPQWRRSYPNGSLAAHVIGFAGADGIGLEGLERTLDRFLRGADGANEVFTDAARRPIWNKPDAYAAPVDGNHVYLTIDVIIQRYLEEALARTFEKFQPESVIGVVVEPASGSILAIASVPTFDPNAISNSTDTQRRNRPVTDIFEPGSIFKPVIAATALADGKVHWGERIFCHNGEHYFRRGRRLRDSKPHGNMTIEEIVYMSSNIGMAFIGERLGNKRMHDVVRQFGFGRPTGVELPGEEGGQVNPLSKWTQDSTWSVPMGQEIAVTGLQITMAFAALANEGVLLQPKLVRKIVRADGEVVFDNAEPIERRRVIPAEICRKFIDGALARVPTDGTARRHARLDGWTSFGKTGTAQIPPYSKGQYTGSYIAGAPVGTPRLVCLVSVRKPDKSVGYYGNLVAGPAVKSVLEQSLAYLNVPKDAR